MHSLRLSSAPPTPTFPARLSPFPVSPVPRFPEKGARYGNPVLFSALCFVALIVCTAPAPARNSASAKPPASDDLLLSGTVSQKGALLLCSADQKLYHVLNSELLRHLEGQLVTLEARYLPGKDQLYVIAVRADSAPRDYSFHLDDAALRH